jgi:superfamily I DNA/RNA helicase
MPRVTLVQHARKSQGSCGKCGTKIKIGDSYRWWKFRYGGRYIRCAKPECAPRASDLTQSAFYSQLYSIQDALSDAIANQSTDDMQAVADDLRSLGEECSSNRDNMPEALQDSETGELLQTRADECESRADEIDSAISDLEGLTTDWKEYAENNSIEKNEDETDEAFEERVTEEMERENESEWSQVDIDLSID